MNKYICTHKSKRFLGDKMFKEFYVIYFGCYSLYYIFYLSYKLSKFKPKINKTSLPFDINQYKNYFLNFHFNLTYFIY